MLGTNLPPPHTQPTVDVGAGVFATRRTDGKVKVPNCSDGKLPSYSRSSKIMNARQILTNSLHSAKEFTNLSLVAKLKLFIAGPACNCRLLTEFRSY
jgi:hypothetical protein